MLPRKTTLENGTLLLKLNYYRAMVKNKLVKEGFGVLSWGDGSKYEG
jgi:hypothetical protein